MDDDSTPSPLPSPFNSPARAVPPPPLAILDLTSSSTSGSRTPTLPASPSKSPTKHFRVGIPSPTKPSLLPASFEHTQSGRATAQEIAEKREAAQLKLAQRKAAAESTRKAAQGQKYLSAYGYLPKISEGGGGMTRFKAGSGGQKRSKIDVQTGELLPPRAPYVYDARCTDEQIAVLDRVREGKNIFYTGPAGVGKSFLMREIRNLLDDLERPFEVTATTGIAALQVNGSTLHSFAGMGLGHDAVYKVYPPMATKVSSGYSKWASTQVLIVDEISMTSPEFFTKLSLLAKLLRRSSLPFGGMQLVLSGDFLQLPPVPEKFPKCGRCGNEAWLYIDVQESYLEWIEVPDGVTAPRIRRCVRDGRGNEGCGMEVRDVRFVFQTEAWAECNFSVMELTKVFRQDDEEYRGILSQLRYGFCSEEMIKTFATYGSNLDNIENILPTNLYPLRKDVKRENETEFEKLKEKAYVFTCRDEHSGPEVDRKRSLERLKDAIEKKLPLKIGAQVMLLANLSIENGLVNGSRGVIINWIKASEPLPSFPPGATASSCGFGTEPWKIEAAKKWEEEQVDGHLPEVYWCSGVTTVVGPHTWVLDLDSKNSVGRTQLPLALAWAVTIHKSQGQSLDAVSVKLDKTFEKGQAYVALSRCRTPQGMRVAGLATSRVNADETVKIFYERLKQGKPFYEGVVNPLHPLSMVLPSELHKFSSLLNYFGPLLPETPRARPSIPIPSLNAGGGEVKEGGVAAGWEDHLKASIDIFLSSSRDRKKFLAAAVTVYDERIKKLPPPIVNVGAIDLGSSDDEDEKMELVREIEVEVPLPKSQTSQRVPGEAAKRKRRKL